jgi:hypothetical protein
MDERKVEYHGETQIESKARERERGRLTLLTVLELCSGAGPVMARAIGEAVAVALAPLEERQVSKQASKQASK